MALRGKSGDIRNTIGEDFDGGSAYDGFDAAADDGYRGELPAGARRGRTNHNGEDLLDWERVDDNEPYDDLPADLVERMEAHDRERMHGGYLERAGLEDDDYGRARIKRN